MTSLFKTSSSSDIKIPLYHLTNGIFIQTDGYISQIYVDVYKKLKDKIPLYIKDIQDEIQNVKIKANLLSDEEIYYNNINYYLRQGLEELNYNVDVHDKGFDILTNISPRTLILITRDAIKKSLKDTELTLITQREIERQRERNDRINEIDMDEIGEDLEL